MSVAFMSSSFPLVKVTCGAGHTEKHGAHTIRQRGRPARRGTGGQASKEGHRRTGKQAGAQEDRQAGRGTGGQASREGEGGRLLGREPGSQTRV